MCVGGCLCGEVRYEISKSPEKVTMCHCSFCQKTTGAAYMVQPALGASDLKITHGQTVVYTHVSEGSGQNIHINFCATCGTKLFQTFDRFDGAIGLYRGSLDDPNWIQVTPENSKHIFVGVAQAETVLPAHVPIYIGHAMQNDGTPNDPIVFEYPTRVGDI